MQQFTVDPRDTEASGNSVHARLHELGRQHWSREKSLAPATEAAVLWLAGSLLALGSTISHAAIDQE